MRWWIATLAAVVLASAGAAHAQGVGAYYKNERWGYKVRPPAEFKAAALSADEEWIASKHTSTRDLASKRSIFAMSDYPQMWVIGFPHQRQTEEAAKIEASEKGITIRFKNPYKNYKDFVRKERWFVGGGYHFSKEEEGTWKGMKVTKYEIKVEKMAPAPSRIVTWVYHFEDIDFAVQCKVLEDYYKKYRSSFNACLKSFRRIDRTEALPGTSSTGEKIVEIEDESKMSREEKALSRRDRFEAKLAREIKNLPKGWKVERSKHYVALYNCSKKYCRHVINHAEVIRKYLDKTLGAVGGDYVPPGMIRIFATDAEQRAFTKSGSTIFFLIMLGGDEIQLNEQSAKGGRKSWEMESVSYNLTSQWLSFKNRMLYDNLPWWFRSGLKEHMEFARVKGKSLKFKTDEYDRQWLKDEIKAGKTVPIRQLFEGGEEVQRWGEQAGSVVSYLLTKGNKGKFKDCIRKYMDNVLLATEAAQAEYDQRTEKLKEDRKAAEMENAGREQVETEDEEAADENEERDEKYWEALREAMKDKEAAIRQKAFDATFGHLSDKDWRRLDRAWLSHAG